LKRHRAEATRYVKLYAEIYSFVRVVDSLSVAAEQMEPGSRLRDFEARPGKRREYPFSRVAPLRPVPRVIYIHEEKRIGRGEYEADPDV
jgi:hypothetical protein